MFIYKSRTAFSYVTCQTTISGKTYISEPYLLNSKKLLFQENVVNGKNRGFVRMRSSLSVLFVGKEINSGCD